MWGYASAKMNLRWIGVQPNPHRGCHVNTSKLESTHWRGSYQIVSRNEIGIRRRERVMAMTMGASSSSLVLSSSFTGRTECIRLLSPATLIRYTSVTISISFIEPSSISLALNATFAGVKADKSSLSKKATKEAVAPKYTKAARRFYNEKFGQSQRLSKILAAAGVASRRASEELIFEGRVKINGAVCKTPQTRVDPLKDAIYVNGNSLPKKLPPKLYFALNKPKGYICSSGEDESKSVLSLLDNYMKIWIKRNPGVPKPRLFTVGRLDVATSGLIIVTNDGDFAQMVSHPSSGLTKEYVATVKGKISRRHLQVVSVGTVVEGMHCTPVCVELISSQPNDLKQRLRIVVCEGRNHEVRHLIENAGLELHSLKRVRVGGFRLPPDIGIGKHRVLGEAQIKKLVGKTMLQV